MNTDEKTAQLEELFRLLTSLDATDRRMAAEDLGILADKRAVPLLMHSLLDPVIAVREAALIALKQHVFPETCVRMIELLISESVPLRNAALEVLQAMAAEACPMLLAGPLYSLSADVRKFSLDIIRQAANLSDAERKLIVERVRPLVEDSDLNVAAAAIEVLAQHGDEGIIDSLLARLDGPIWLQCHVIQALAHIPGKRAAESLTRIDGETLAPVAKVFLTEAIESRKRAA